MLLSTSTREGRDAQGACTVSGHVLNDEGTPVDGADVTLVYSSGNDYYRFGWARTDANGAFSFAEVPETVDGRFYVDRPDGDGYQSWGNVFVAGAANDFVLQPGLLAASIWRTDRRGWDDWRWLRVETYGSGGGGTTWIAGDAYAMPPDCGYAVAYPWDNQGIEWTSWDPLGVVAGARIPAALRFDQDEGRGAWFAEPYWASGAPGTRTRSSLTTGRRATKHPSMGTRRRPPVG